GAFAHLDGVGPQSGNYSAPSDGIKGYGGIACRVEIARTASCEPVHHNADVNSNIFRSDKSDVRPHSLADANHLTVNNAAVIQQYSANPVAVGQNPAGAGAGLYFQSCIVQCISDQGGILGFH